MLGEVNVKDLGVTFVKFIELARTIRGKLGARKYLLDRYLLDLLEAASGISPMDLTEAGEDAAERLRKLCRQAVCKDGAVRETIIGEQIQAYIEAHPSAYFEECTKAESYVADLSDLYLEHAAQRYLEEQENELLFRYDPHGGDELYQTIVRLIGGENDMERLCGAVSAGEANGLIYPRVHPGIPLFAALPGYADRPYRPANPPRPAGVLTYAVPIRPDESGTGNGDSSHKTASPSAGIQCRYPAGDCRRFERK